MYGSQGGRNDDQPPDAGPLIALAKTEYLPLLRALYREILVPPAVLAELCLGSRRPGSQQLANAVEQGWLQIKKPSGNTASSLSELVLILDSGEAEAIFLAEEVECRFLLIDERKGRSVAKRRGIPVAGTAGVMLAAKKRGLVDEVMPILKSLEEIGYRISVTLTKEIAKLAGEDN